MAKMIDVFIISLILTALYIIICLTLGFVNNDDASGGMWGKANYIFLVLLQTFSQLSIAFLVAYMVRKAFIGLGVFFFYFIAEQIGAAVIKEKTSMGIEKFLPLEVSDKLIVVPPFIGKTMDQKNEWYGQLLDGINYQVAYTLIVLAITWGICFWLNNKRDL
jgi:ABC-type transport system involved in multi-copper enzyme maturation permease subunit